MGKTDEFKRGDMVVINYQKNRFSPQKSLVTKIIGKSYVNENTYVVETPNGYGFYYFTQIKKK